MKERKKDKGEGRKKQREQTKKNKVRKERTNK